MILSNGKDLLSSSLEQSHLHSLSTQCSVMDIAQGRVPKSNHSVLFTRLFGALFVLTTSGRQTVV